MRLGARVPLVVALGGVGLCGAGGAAGAALWRVLMPVALPSADQPRTEASPTAPSPRPAYAAARVLAAVDKDPFQPDRRRPAKPFVLSDGGRRRRDDASAPVGVRVIGTAVLSNGGGFAICQRSGGSPTLVRLGGTLGDLTLKAVEPGAATFVTASGATLVVRVLKSGGGS